MPTRCPSESLANHPPGEDAMPMPDVGHNIFELLMTAAQLLRSYQRTSPGTPDVGRRADDSTRREQATLAADVADAIDERLRSRTDLETLAAFGEGFVLGVLEAPTEAMLVAGEGVMQAEKAAAPRELVRRMAAAMLAEGMSQQIAARRAAIAGGTPK